MSQVKFLQEIALKIRLEWLEYRVNLRYDKGVE